MPYCVAMTVAAVVPPPSDTAATPPPGRRGPRWVVGILITLLLGTCGAVVSATYYYDSVPLVEHAVPSPAVPVASLPLPVRNAFVAAVDPGFYDAPSGVPLTTSLVTRRYMVIASGAGVGATPESSWRIRVMADKAEAEYPQAEILDRYLNSADYGRGAVGLVAAARTYFGKPAAQLTVAEAALLAVLLHPDGTRPEAGWARVLDTMVERGWLGAAERGKLAFPG